MPKRGETRADGMRFKGYEQSGKVARAHWLSEAAYERFCERMRQASRRHYAKKVSSSDGRGDVNAKRKVYVTNNLERILLASAKCRAKRQGLAFDLELVDVVIPAVCPVLGIPLERGAGRTSPGSPTLDRLDNRAGYVRGNVVVMSHRANAMKRDACLEELRLLVKFLERVGRGHDDGGLT